VAEHTLSIAATERFGLYHLMCHGDTTWADFAREAARLLGRDPGLVDSVATASLGETIARPRNALIANHALQSIGADHMPHWRDALAAYLESDERSRT
jgi:dTDP-4-dehydrorhamnose reductase